MTYSFPLWVPATAVLVALVPAAIGIVAFVRTRSREALGILMLVASLVAGVIAPMLALDRVVIDEQKLEQTTGFWFSPTVKGFPLANLSSISIETARDRKDRPYDLWVGTYANGTVLKVDPGDLWDLNGEDIARRLRARGISVTDSSE